MKRLLTALLLILAPAAALAQGSGSMCASRPGFLGCLPAVTTLLRTNVVPVSQVDVARNATIAQILGLISASDLTTAAAAYAPLASPTLSGVPIAPTASAGTSTTQIATTQFASLALALKANLASPSFTGTVAMATPLAVTSGGTGAATAGAALTALGAAPVASPSFTGAASAATSFTAPLFQATTTNGAAVFRGNGTGTTQLGAAAASPVAALYYFSLTVGSGLTAAGTTQGTALVLANQVNEVTTAAASTGVLLPNVAAGTMITVYNRGANAVLVYPPTGDNIESSAANVGVSLAAGATGRYMATTTTQWRSG